MDLILLFTMIIASIVFVGIVMILTRLISPRTHNRQKGESYECGIPTQGATWIQNSFFLWEDSARCSFLSFS